MSAPAPAPYIFPVFPTDETNSGGDYPAASFRPSIAVIIGVLTTMFSLTFLLLIYAKHCRRASGSGAGIFGYEGTEVAHNNTALPLLPACFSEDGVSKDVIDALPVFSFSVLKGDKHGLECPVCLSKYDEHEVLRFLPRCKHAFHIECVGKWLLSHSTCPLCRCSVSVNDLPLVEEIFASTRSMNLDFSNPASPRRASLEDVGLQIFIQRDDRGNSKRLGSSGRMDRMLLHLQDSGPPAENSIDENSKRFDHKIIFSDVFMQRRWSDFVKTDALFLTSQSLLTPGNRAVLSDSKGGSSSLGHSKSRSAKIARSGSDRYQPSLPKLFFSHCIPDPKDAVLVQNPRCMSEITGLDRRKKDPFRPKRLGDQNEEEDTEQTRQWTAIAKKTLGLVTGKEKKASNQRSCSSLIADLLLDAVKNMRWKFCSFAERKVVQG